MNESSPILYDFMHKIYQKCRNDITTPLCLPTIVLFNKFKELNSKNNSYRNEGTFVRSIKMIIKDYHQVDVITTKNRKGRFHYFIIRSDLLLSLSDRTPGMLEAPTEYLIQVIFSDIVQNTDSYDSDNANTEPTNAPTVFPTVTPTETPTQAPFPLLHSLGVNTDFESNEIQLVNLMSELVALFNRSNKPLNFIHRGNDKPGRLVAIPKSKNYVSFDRTQRRTKWLDNVVHSISDKNNNPDETWYWMMREVYKHRPHVVIHSAKQLGLIVSLKMTEIEAAAMWVESNVSIRAARIILKHLHCKFGQRMQVPFTRIASLSNVTESIMPIFCEFEYNKSEETKSEKVKYWTIDPCDLVELDFTRLLNSLEPQLATFGYFSKIFPSSTLGVYVIIGADHGGGKSRYLMRINYEPSSYRRKLNKTDAGTRTVQFAEVSCKKDTHPIQAKIAPTLNKAIKRLEDSKLIALRIGNEIIKCKFVPSNSKGIVAVVDTSDNICLSYELHDDKVFINIPVSTRTLNPNHDKIHCWTVIQCFKVVIAGDLSFFATSTGRDGHSHCRCVYCDSSYQAWNDNNSHPPTTMTLSHLHYYADMYSKSKVPKKIDTKGVVMRPLIEIDPQRYIVPLLHLSIGIVNKLWSSFLMFLDEFVEKLSLDESVLKMKIDSCQKDIHELEESMEILTVNKQMACAEYAVSYSNETKMLIEECKVELKKKKS